MAMDAFTKSMTGTAIGIGSVALVGESLKMLPKGLLKHPGKMKSIHPVSSKKLIKGGANILVGASLLGAASSMIQ